MADWLKKRLGDWHLKRWWIDWLHSFLAALWAFVAICTHAGQTGNESKTSSKQQKTHAIGCAACQLAINKKGTSKSKLHAHCMQRQARRRLVAACKEQRDIPVWPVKPAGFDPKTTGFDQRCLIRKRNQTLAALNDLAACTHQLSTTNNGMHHAFAVAAADFELLVRINFL